MCSPFTKRMVFLRRRNEDLLAQLETNSVVLEERLKKLHETAKAPFQSQNKVKKRKSKVWNQRNSSGQVSAALCPDLPQNPSEESSNPEEGATDLISEPLVAKESTVMLSSLGLQPQKVAIPSRRITMKALEQKHIPECYANTVRATRNEKRKRACVKTCPLCSCLDESGDPFRDLDLRKKTLETARAMICYSPESTFLRGLKVRSHIELNNQGATKPITTCICFPTQPSSDSSDSAEINQSTDQKKSKSSILPTRTSPLKAPSVNVSKCPITKQRTRFSTNLSDTDESRLTLPNSRKSSSKKMLCSNISKHSEPRSRSSGMTPYHALSHARCSASSKSSQLKTPTCYHPKNAPAATRRKTHRTSPAVTDGAVTDKGSPAVSMCRCSKRSSLKKSTGSGKASRAISSAVCEKRRRSCRCPHRQPQGYDVLAPLVENERDLGAAVGKRQSRKTSQTEDIEREYRKISQSADLERDSKKEQVADFGGERESRKLSQIAESAGGEEIRQRSAAADFGSWRRGDGTDVTEDDRVDRLSEFRRSNWFDTHAHQTGRDALGNALTDSHECIHRYIVNDRLFATPVYADSQNRSRCMQCHLPRDMDTSRPTQQQPAQPLNKDDALGPPQQYNADAHFPPSQQYGKEDIRSLQYNLPRKMDAQPPKEFGVSGEMGFKRAHREQIRVTLPQRLITRSSDLRSTEAGFHISGAAGEKRETRRVATCMLQHAIKCRPAIPKPPKPAHSLALRFQKGMS